MTLPAPIRLKAPSSRETGRQMSETTGEKHRLLIVDDSKVIRVTARKILQGHFETVEAVDGENAWEILNGMGPFSLVVSDLTMPKLDGFGLLEKIRAAHDPDINSLPVIVITGDNDSEKIMQRAREAGATDFIGKPFDAVHLLARAQSHASAHAERQSLTDQMISLEDQALIDPQTGLANETAFLERGHQQLSYAIRHKTTLTVAEVEIDNYGELARQYGDPVTGMVSKYAATVLESGIRHEDMAARIGPARFAMLLTGMEWNGVQALADRICRNIRDRVIRHGSEEIRFTVSIGICSPDIHIDTLFEELLETAGKNLQQAITQGGNCSILANTANPAADTVEDETPTDSNPYPAIDENILHDGSEYPAGTSPMALQETDIEDMVAVLDDESIAEMIAGTFQQPVPDEDVIEYETVQQDDAPETVAEETTAEEALPQMFAEPVTGVSKKLANKVARARELAAAEQEEIIITAPFTAYNDSTPATGDQTAPAQEPETGANSDLTETATDPEAAVSGHTAAPRPGFFRRMLSLFSRSR